MKQVDNKSFFQQLWLSWLIRPNSCIFSMQFSFRTGLIIEGRPEKIKLSQTLYEHLQCQIHLVLTASIWSESCLKYSHIMLAYCTWLYILGLFFILSIYSFIYFLSHEFRLLCVLCIICSVSLLFHFASILFLMNKIILRNWDQISKQSHVFKSVIKNLKIKKRWKVMLYVDREKNPIVWDSQSLDLIQNWTHSLMRFSLDILMGFRV